MTKVTGRIIACRPPLRRVLAACAALAAAPAHADETSLSTLLFGSLDAGSSSFLTVGTKITLGRSDRDGFAILASGGGGVRREDGPTIRGIATSATRHTAIGAVLAGYQWFYAWGVVGAYAGPEGSGEFVTDVSGVSALPFRYGIRLHGEIWARPSDDTLLTATAILGSTRESAWGRLAWGYDLWGAYLGPEAALYVDGTGYSKLGLGMHATDFRLGGVSFRASLGYQTESEGGGSPYLSLSIWQPW